MAGALPLLPPFAQLLGALLFGCATLATCRCCQRCPVGLLQGIAGLEAWRWLFIIEGIPAVLLGAYWWFLMPASPATAPMLTEPERAALVGALAAVHRHDAEEQQVVSRPAGLLSSRGVS